jgi:hypothetical protein
MDKYPAPLRGCLEATIRCTELLQRFEGKDATADPASFHRVGPHLRHCLDHFEALRRGLDAGQVEYDARDRDPSLENDPACCQAAIQATDTWLRELAESSPDLQTPLIVSQASCSTAAPTESRSTLERELIFLSGHTIHHLAVVSWICKEIGIELPDDFTLAFSTQAYRETSGA